MWVATFPDRDRKTFYDVYVVAKERGHGDERHEFWRPMCREFEDFSHV